MKIIQLAIAKQLLISQGCNDYKKFYKELERVQGVSKLGLGII